ncbi:hypothetical protein FM121_04470 [Vagococcus fluvialis bH819]|uniref:Uncharacterized protein n=1 Tax=Vagococcus fluvialis bH819 TaxID=1255619 RepID=A0A1X6WM51_9ENTE|nr:hypothetical protein FM121_04470 [Vagococcus fluvialis bH819]
MKLPKAQIFYPGLKQGGEKAISSKQLEETLMIIQKREL